MWAKVEVDEEILNFIDYAKNHNETLDEMKELVFTKQRLNHNYSMTDLMNFNFIFQKIKCSALEKVLKNENLNFPEGFVFERLLAKYSNEEFLSVEDHMNQIKLSCGKDRKSKRENDRKFKKLYSNFIKNIFS